MKCLTISAVALSMLGFALDRSGDHERAIEVLKRAVKLRPDGFLALHYGLRTPVSVLIAHVVFGIVLGAFYRI